MTPVGRTVTLCLVFAAGVLGMFFYSVIRSPELTNEQLGGLGVVVFPAPRELEPLGLTATTGEPFAREDFEGRWSFLFFGFTHCPDICPTSMAVLAQARAQIARDMPDAVDEFQGVLVTVDPERDDLQTLGSYVKAFSPTFVGVRADRATTAAVAAQFNVAFAQVPADGGGYSVDHSGHIAIVDPAGHYHGLAKMPHRADTIAKTFSTLRSRWR